MGERLRDLDASFISSASRGSYRIGGMIDGAQGVMFQCPSCGAGLERGEEDGRRFIKGAHYIRVFFANPRGAPVAPPECMPEPRWQMSGTSLDDLTVTPSINCDVPWTDAQGVQRPSSCKFHAFVTNGAIA